MAAAADIELDMDFMDELDALSAVPCDLHDHCELEAEWRIVVSCCAAVFLFCHEHHDALLSLMEKIGAFVCSACGTLVPARTAITIADRI